MHNGPQKDKQMETQRIPETIFHQLGGQKMVAMTGARNFIYDDSERQLVFRIGAKYIEITLEFDDLYTVKIQRLCKLQIKTDVKLTGLFVDQLVPILEEKTGLRFSL